MESRKLFKNKFIQIIIGLLFLVGLIAAADSGNLIMFFLALTVLHIIVNIKGYKAAVLQQYYMIQKEWNRK